MVREFATSMWGEKCKKKKEKAGGTGELRFNNF
jgi:hypothetical protein